MTAVAVRPRQFAPLRTKDADLNRVQDAIAAAVNPLLRQGLDDIGSDGLPDLSPSPAGTYGDAGNVPRVTVDAKGRTTAVTTQAATLPDLSPSPAGTYGDSTTIPRPTVNAKGLVTAVATVALDLPVLSPSPAGTYGDSTTIPKPTVDSRGRVTAVATVALDLPVLSPSPAGTYGDSTHVSRVTVDSRGRVTVASEVAIPGAGAADAYWSQTVLAARFATDLTDAKGHSLTAYGDAAVSAADSRWGVGSLLLDGTGDYVGAADSADWDFGTGDFTVEAWVKIASGASVAGLMIASAGDPADGNSWALWANGGDPSNLNFSVYYSGAWHTYTTFTQNLVWDRWHHVAVDRCQRHLSMFADGTLVLMLGAATATSVWDDNSFDGGSSGLNVGCRLDSGTPSYLFKGRIEDVRITKGAARYSVAPKAAILLG